MRTTSRAVLAALFLLWAMNVAEAVEAPKAVAGSAGVDVKWQDSEAGRFVFFAVLEGLYEDGVSKEVVDLVINPTREMDSKVKHAFVFQCDICHAAYEAFVLYNRRQTFQRSSGRDTFGKGVGEKFENLRSADAMTRVHALGDMIQPWIVARVVKMKLSNEKQDALVETLLKFKEEANNKLSTLRREDVLYKDWAFYGGCQACEAATAITKLNRESTPK